MRLLIVRIGALGDFIQTLPVLATIRHYFPEATIDLWGYPSLMELVHGRYYVDHVSRFDQPEISRLFSEDPSLLKTLADDLKEFDVILSYVGGADRTFTRNLKRVNSRRVIAQSSLPDPRERVHIIDHLLKPVLDLGLEPPSKIPKLYLTGEDRRFADLFLSRHGIRTDDDVVIAIHPGSGGRQKCWPAERFAEVVRRISEEDASRVLLIEGPADGDGVKKVLDTVPGLKLTLLRNLSLVELASILERCHAFLGNDSGVTHLAAAVGTKALAIFGPTDPEIWGPRGEHVGVVYRPCSCAPCEADRRRTCRCLECLGNIGVAEVMDALRTFVSRTP